MKLFAINKRIDLSIYSRVLMLNALEMVKHFTSLFV